MNDAAAYIRSLAQLRGRNAEWAEKAVREAASLSASEALAQQGRSTSSPPTSRDLLRQLDGRKVARRRRRARAAARTARRRSRVEPDWRTALLSVITDPSVA